MYWFEKIMTIFIYKPNNCFSNIDNCWVIVNIFCGVIFYKLDYEIAIIQFEFILWHGLLITKVAKLEC